MFIPFEVNNGAIRETFFKKFFSDCIVSLDEHTPPLWGAMTARNMVEHLLWAFEASTGSLELPCCTPQNFLEPVKKILYDDRTMPHNFKNPLIGNDPIPFRFSTFAETKAALQKETLRFLDHFREQPESIHTHPIFGPLGAEEWSRAHFKHTYHHLLQFGLIDQSGRKEQNFE